MTTSRPSPEQQVAIIYEAGIQFSTYCHRVRPYLAQAPALAADIMAIAARSAGMFEHPAHLDESERHSLTLLARVWWQVLEQPHTPTVDPETVPGERYRLAIVRPLASLATYLFTQETLEDQQAGSINNAVSAAGIYLPALWWRHGRSRSAYHRPVYELCERLRTELREVYSDRPTD